MIDKMQFQEEEEHEQIVKNVTQYNHNSKHNKSGERGLRLLWRDARLRSNLIFSNFLWCSIVINYYIIAFYLKYFPGDIYQNTFAFVMADLSAYLLLGTILKKTIVGKSLILAQLISGIGGVFYFTLHTYVKLIPIIVLFCRFGISMSFNTVYAGNNRLFPTKFLSTSFGIVNFISHILAIGAPLIAELEEPYPFWVFVGLCLIALVSSIFLKEEGGSVLNKD